MRGGQAAEGGQPADADPDRGRAAAPARGRARRSCGRIVTLALITGARVGELLALRWEDVTDGDLTFLETKNGTPRRLPLSPAMQGRPGRHARGYGRPRCSRTRGRTTRYTVNGVAHVFRRAVERAGILTGDVTPAHAATHGAEPDDRAAGIDDYTVMAISRAQLDADAGALHASDRARGRSDALDDVSRASMGRIWAERRI